ncbi:hypothetical protein HanIR_Chr07g0304141 [Helianthus annuus]|nr:hypothetical protein HanIR_Chr07g0304141 [Helianthus annuus]
MRTGLFTSTWYHNTICRLKMKITSQTRINNQLLSMSSFSESIPEHLVAKLPQGL